MSGFRRHAPFLYADSRRFRSGLSCLDDSSFISGTIGDNAALGERVRRGMKLLFQQFPVRTVAAGGN